MSKTPSARTRTSSACLSCKRKRAKCSGEPAPCRLCLRHGAECDFDLLNDKRRKSALLQASNESKSYAAALNYLLECLRAESSSDLDALASMVRSGASSHQITRSIHRRLEQSDSQKDTEAGKFPQAVPLPLRKRMENTASGEVSTKSGHGRLEEQSNLEIESRPAQWLTLQVPERPQEEVTTKGKAVTTDADPDRRSSIPVGKMSFTSDIVKPATFEDQLLLVGSEGCVMSEQSQPTDDIQDGGTTPATSTISSLDFSVGQLRALSPLHISSNRSKRSQYDNQLQVPDSSSTDVRSIHQFFEPMTSLCASPQVDGSDLLVAQPGDMTRQRIPRYLIFPLIFPHNSPRSRTYTDYWQGARKILRIGANPISVLGYPGQTAVDLLFRPREVEDKFTCASWACEVCRTSGTDIFVQLATVHLLTTMMQWLLVPTRENYDMIPDMMRPTPLQCMVAHPGEFDTIPLPPLRDAVIRKPRDWLSPLIQCGCTVHWTLGLDVATEQDVASGTTILTQKFIQHVSKYGNWSVGRKFLEAFPEVTGQIRLHDLPMTT